MAIYNQLLGITIGLMLLVWSIWILYHYYQLPVVAKKFKKVHLWLGILMLLIGIADLSKAIQDLFKSIH